MPPFVISPTRQYEIHMLNEESDSVVVLIELPESLKVNNATTAEIYYRKYVPEGHVIVDVTVFEESEDYVGFGDELDYVGPDEEDQDGFSIVEVDDEDPKEEPAV